MLSGKWHMRTRGALIVAVVVAVVVLSLVADSGRAGRSVITGTVIDWRPGESITVANDQTDPWGVRIVLRETVYEGESGAIKPGVLVTVWYRGVGESRPIANRVRVHPEAATP